MKKRVFFAFVLALIVFLSACGGLGGGKGPRRGRRSAVGLDPDTESVTPDEDSKPGGGSTSGGNSKPGGGSTSGGTATPGGGSTSGGTTTPGYKNPQGIFEIYNADQLIWIAAKVNAGDNAFPNVAGTDVRLMNDIDLDRHQFDGIAIGGSAVYNAGFNGNGFVIENMYVYSPSSDYVGFIGKTSSTAVVQNIRFKKAKVKGKNRVGIVVGYNQGKIDACGVGGGTADATGLIVGEVEGNDSVGGIAGYNGDGGIITQCYNMASVTATETPNEGVGGIAGHNSMRGFVRDTYNTGLVVVLKNSLKILRYDDIRSPAVGLGGIVGVNRASYNQSTDRIGVMKSYSVQDGYNGYYPKLVGSGLAAWLSPEKLTEISKNHLSSMGVGNENWDFNGIWYERNGRLYLRNVK